MKIRATFECKMILSKSWKTVANDKKFSLLVTLISFDKCVDNFCIRSPAEVGNELIEIEVIWLKVLSL